MMTLAQAAAWMAQTLPQVQYGSAAAAEGAQHLALQRVHTDSRSVQPGDLFIALRGERLDAHDFLAQAQAAGAAAAVVELGRSLPGLPCLEVSDTTAALGALAAGNTERFHALLGPTVPLSRHIFQAPTRFYKTGVVFMAWLNGHQSHFSMVGGQQSTRSITHFAELFRLADAADLLEQSDLATHRMKTLLALHGIDA